MRVPQAAWDRITSSNTGDKLVVTVSRWDGVASAAYTSVTESFTIAPESLRGAIYYWAATSNVGWQHRPHLSRKWRHAGHAQPRALHGLSLGQR